MKENNKAQRLTAILFAVYMATLVWIVIFKLQLSPDTLPALRRINLVPFFMGNATAMASRNDLVYNTLAFIPYGIYICMLMQGRPFVQRLLPIFATSLLFEVTQYVFGIGATDINDLLLNTLGGMIGIGVYCIFAKVFKARSHGILNALTAVATVLMLALIIVMSFFLTYRF